MSDTEPFRSQLPIDHLRTLTVSPEQRARVLAGEVVELLPAPPTGKAWRLAFAPSGIVATEIDAKAESTPDTLTSAVRDLFVRQPSTWIDGRSFQAIGGFAGWSARIRDCRKAPHRMVIINRTRRQSALQADGSYTVTEYVWLPLAQPQDITAAVRAKVRAFAFTGRPLADWEAVKYG